MRPSKIFLNFITVMALVFSSAAIQAQSQPAQSPTTAAPSPSAKADDAMELVKHGEKLNSEGKPDEAIALYQRALQLSPDLYQAQLFMGVALDLQGNYTEARQHLSKAIELANEAETVQALRIMAVSYAFERNTDEASKYERRAFDLQYKWQKYTEAAGTADELARIYLEAGDLDNAFQWYQTGKITALRNPNITPAEKELWEFRYNAALARIAARRGQKGAGAGATGCGQGGTGQSEQSRSTSLLSLSGGICGVLYRRLCHRDQGVAKS